MSFIIDPYRFATAGGAPSFPSIGSIWEWWEPEREGLADNDPVSQVTGQANARHFLQTGSEKPTYKANQINGLGAVRMEQSKWLNFPDMSALTASHFFLVIKIDADPPVSGAGGLHRNSSGSTDAHYPFNDSNIYECWGTSSRLTVGNPAAALTSWRVYEVISISGEFTVLLDGTQLNTRATNTVGWNSTTRPFGQTAAGNWTNGYWAGAYQFSAKITGADRTSLINYINSRFGLSSS